MLKNNYETKKIMEEWRKVLNEGLYDQDPEVLEEILTKASREKVKSKLAAGLMLLATTTGIPSIVSAKVTNLDPAIQKSATGVYEFSKDPDYKEFAKQLPYYKFFKDNFDVIKKIIEKLSDSENHELSPEEIQIMNELSGASKEIRKGLELYFNTVKKVAEEDPDLSKSDFDPILLEIIKAIELLENSNF